MSISDQAKNIIRGLKLRGFTEEEAFEELLKSGSATSDERTEFTGIWRGAADEMQQVAPQPPQGNRRQNQRGNRGRGQRNPRNQVEPLEPQDASGVRNTYRGSMIRSRYRFIRLSEKVIRAQSPARLPLDQPDRESYDARLNIDWQFETPVLTHAQKPLIIDKAPIIMGSTFRGYLRAMMEKACFSRLAQTDRNARFGLRDFDDKYYESVGQKGGVKAGWILKDGDGYSILPCNEHGQQWGCIEVCNLRDHDVIKSNAIHANSDDEYRFKWAKLDRRRKKQSLTKLRLVSLNTQTLGSGICVNPKADTSRDYAISKSEEANAVLVVTGQQPLGRFNPDRVPSTLRRVEYVLFPPKDATQPVVISADSWRRFEYANCKFKRNKMEPDGEWAKAALQLEKGEAIPVWWVGNVYDQKEDFGFGLTRLFKIPVKHSVGEKLPAAHRPPDLKSRSDFHPDMTEALFGYVLEGTNGDYTINGERDKGGSIARASRILFSIGKATKDQFKAGKTEKAVFGAPKASFGPFYLTGGKREWSADDTKLAGRKTFLPRYQPGGHIQGAISKDLRSTLPDKRNDDITSDVTFLNPTEDGGVFTSTIKLRGVTKEELGAVLWCLAWGGDQTKRHLIGRAKGFGCGQCRASVTSMTAERIDGEASYDETKIPDLIHAFERFMEDQAGPGGWKASGSIQDLLASGSIKVGKWLADNGLLTHPNLPDFRKIKKAARTDEGETYRLHRPSEIDTA